MNFKTFLTESNYQVVIITMCATDNYKKSFEDDILSCVIGSKDKLSKINGNFSLRSEVSEDTPYVLMENGTMKQLHAIKVIENFNKSLDVGNSIADKVNDFKVFELEKHFKIFASENAAEVYFNKNRDELIERFTKAARRPPMNVIFVQLNTKDGPTFNIIGTMKIAKEEKPIQIETDKAKI